MRLSLAAYVSSFFFDFCHGLCTFLVLWAVGEPWIAKLNRIRLHLDDLVTRMGEQLYGGQIAAEPLVVSTNRSPCAWCDYDFICCHETGIGERGLEAPAKPFEPEAAAEDEEEPT